MAPYFFLTFQKQKTTAGHTHFSIFSSNKKKHLITPVFFVHFPAAKNDKFENHLLFGTFQQQSNILALFTNKMMFWHLIFALSGSKATFCAPYFCTFQQSNDVVGTIFLHFFSSKATFGHLISAISSSITTIWHHIFEFFSNQMMFSHPIFALSMMFPHPIFALSSC